MSKQNIIQVLIVIGTGVTAFMVASKNRQVRRAGFVVGILCQPMWFASAYWTKQWGIAITCFWYVFCYGRGFWNTKPEKAGPDRVAEG